jgi:DNA-binding SARP family transcriptional activator/WD40 repeat protein
MGIRVLGALTIDDGTVEPGRRDRVVLAALATAPGEVLAVGQLADALWGDHPPASSAKVVQGCIARLRRSLGADLIETAPPGYRLALPPDTLDAERFERAVTRARSLLTLGQPDRAAYTVDEALALWRGRPFVELEEWQPAVVAAARLDQLRLEAEEIRVQAALLGGRAEDVVATAAALVHAAPLRERRWALLARAQYATGQQGDALRSLREARSVLVERLGVDPGPELTALESAILRQDPELVPPADLTMPDRGCPYRGLAAFGVDDTDEFFGRNQDREACLAVLDERGVLAVVGPSGLGKSSFVRAGIAATLIARGDRVRVITPGSRPAEALRDVPEGQVVVVDQLEELFSPQVEQAERRLFVEELAARAQAGRVVLALRSDRLAEVADHPQLARLVEAGLYLLGPLGDDALAAVIEEPARLYGLLLEPGLVELLVHEVAGQPGAMPLLSHALRETWLRREGSTLTVAGYRASGGIRGAVARTAETLFSGLDADDRRRLRTAMLRLVVPSPDGIPVRARIPRRQLEEVEPSGVLERLVDARLVTSEAGEVELAHESLTRAWPRLQAWLDEDVEGQRILHGLSGAADTWDLLGRPDSELYRGVRLARVREWVDHAQPTLTSVERDFLAASTRLARAEEASLAEHAARQARMIRRLRLSLAGGAFLLVLALLAGLLALQQAREARENARATAAAEQAAEAGRLGARALTVQDPTASLLLAVEGVTRDETAQTRGSLFAALERRPGLDTTFTAPASAALVGLAASPDGRWLAAYGHDNVVHLFDARTARLVESLDIDGPDVVRSSLYPSGAVAFSPDSQTLAVGTQIWTEDPVQLYDVDTLERVGPLPGLPRRAAKVVDLAYSADGNHLVASFLFLAPDAQPGLDASVSGGDLRVWDLRDRARMPDKVPLEAPPSWDRVRIDADGSRVYTGGPPRAFAVGRPRPRWVRDGLTTLGGPIALSPDGRRLVTPHVEGAAVRDTRSGSVIRTLGPISLGVAVSPDGRLVASSDDLGRIRVWTLESGELVAEFDEGGIGEVTFSPDSKLLYSVGQRREVHAWDLTGNRRVVGRQTVSLDRPTEDSRVQVAPGGDSFAVSVLDGDGSPADATAHVMLVDSVTGEQARTAPIGRPGIVMPGSWAPDGQEFAAGNEDGDIIVVPLIGQVRRHPRAVASGVVALAHVDDSRLVVADRDGGVHLLDEDMEPQGPVVQVEGLPSAVAAAPDGRTALVLAAPAPAGPSEYSGEASWSLLDLREGVVTDTGAVPGGTTEVWSSAKASPTGDRFALVGADAAWFLDPARGDFVTRPAPVHTSGEDGNFAPDGSTFASMGNDGTVAVWDPATGRLESLLQLERDDAQNATPDGRGTVVVAGPHSVYSWDTGLETAVDAACRAAGRPLTRAEWRRYVSDGDPRNTCADHSADGARADN